MALCRADSHPQALIDMKTLLALLLTSICSNLLSGDLIFEIADDGAMSRAIADATAPADSLQFSHVGIIEVDDQGGVSVIEATGRSGVTITPLDSFMIQARAGVVVMRINGDFPAQACIERAKSFLGMDYDWWYLPDNNKIYCSELVEKSYLNADGSPIFVTIPMNFRDKYGNMPQFWIDLFARLGRPIPEGLPGSNPTQISRSPLLQVVQILR